MTTNSNLTIVRSNKIEEGKRYLVEIHGIGQKWMKAKSVPAVGLVNMTPKDAFVFGGTNGRGEDLILRTHGTGGPQFLVAKVPGKRGGMINARVTFYAKEAATATVEQPKKKAA